MTFALILCMSLTSSAIIAEHQDESANDKAIVDKNKTSQEAQWSVNALPEEFTTATIEVNQGTWMNVDISPDGNTLVFDLLGDNYTLPITSG